MSKEDRYGATAAVFAGMMAWADPGWRTIWLAIGIGMSAWTFHSLSQRR